MPDQTTAADVTAQRPVQTADGTVVVHGGATGADGARIDLGQLEQRLIAGSADVFAKNARRMLRAPGDGTIAYDTATSTTWTATFTGLSADDVARALRSESAVLWLGRDALGTNELATFENGPGVAGGPAAGFCTAPLEGGRPQSTITPASVSFGKLAPGTSSSTADVKLANSGAGPMTIRSVYIAGADYPQAFKIAAKTCGTTLAPGASCTVTLRFDAGTALGQRSASLNFATDAANDGFQSVPLTAETIQVAPPANLRQTISAGTSLGTPGSLATSTLPITLQWAASTDAGVTYELQESKDGGAFVTVATPAPGTTSVSRSVETRTLASMPKYQYRVRAIAPHGRVSAWAGTGQFTVMPVDDKDAVNLKWGGTWSVESDTRSWGGSVRYATTRGAGVKLNRITFSTLGNFAWIGSVGPAMGQARISVDGGTWQTVDMYAPATEAKRAVVVWAANNLAAGVQHDIQIELLGTKQGISTGTRVDVDGVIALR